MMRRYSFMVWSCLIVALQVVFVVFWSPRLVFVVNTYFSSPVSTGNGSGSKPRLNVIILTHMSSGSTFLGNLFNLHPDVFYLYEPLNELRRYVHGDRNDLLEWNVLDKNADEKYRSGVFDILRACFTCDFKENQTMNYVFPEWLKNEHFLAWNSGDITKETTREACKSRNITVIKIMQTRLPGKSGIRALQQICSSESEKFQCMIIHLVRDPRAVISSLLKHKFYMKPDGDTGKLMTIDNSSQGREIIRRYSKIMCLQVEENLNHVNEERSKWFKGRYILVRYEDAVKELSTTEHKLYNFTGLPAATSITKWIVEGIRPSGITNENNPAFKVSQNDVNRIDQWRSLLKSSQVTDFEEQCWALMNMMGYLSINGSEVILRDTNEMLYTDEIPFAPRI